MVTPLSDQLPALVFYLSPPVFRADIHDLPQGKQFGYVVSIMIGYKQYLAKDGVILCMRDWRKEIDLRVCNYLDCRFQIRTDCRDRFFPLRWGRLHVDCRPEFRIIRGEIIRIPYEFQYVELRPTHMIEKMPERMIDMCAFPPLRRANNSSRSTLSAFFAIVLYLMFLQ